MEQIIKNDLSWEHIHHTKFLKNCSTCFKEEKLHKEWVKSLRENLGTSIGYGRIEDIINNPNPLKD